MPDYIVNSPGEQQAMLAAIGLRDVADLYRDLPDDLCLQTGPDIPAGLSEAEVYRHMRAKAEKNKVYPTIFRGAGAYRHVIPAAVDKLAERSEFLTAYTPYQAELAQGSLQCIFEFQTHMARLSGMDAANASVYDGATAAAEAVLMTVERRRRKILLSPTCNPGLLEVVITYCKSSGLPYEMLSEKDGLLDLESLCSRMNAEVASLLMDQINYYGLLENCQEVAALVHAQGGKVILNINPIAAALLMSARDCGADIAVGEGQPLGLPLMFGGPYVGFMATTAALQRRLPGRIVGQALDREGQTCYVLTLQAREQHIRRERAVSSICSNQALMAVRATIYLALLGSEGLQETARLCVNHAHYLADKLQKIEGLDLVYKGEFFHEFVIRTGGRARQIEALLHEQDILSGLVLDEDRMLWCATEANTQAEMDRCSALVEARLANRGGRTC